MYKAKQAFLWYSYRDEIKEEDLVHCEYWEKQGLVELIKPVKEANKEELDLDVNNDGKVDEKDVSVMAKVIGKRGGRPRKKVSRKK